MTQSISHTPGEYYNVYNRGADKRKIFLDKADHERFLTLLYLCNSGIPLHRSDVSGDSAQKIFLQEKETTLVDIGAYSLMPNHFHILMREQSDGGISLFMKKLSTAYAMYFNKRHRRSGTLFEGRYKTRHADNDEYLKYLFAYIHLNPIGIVEKNWKVHQISNKKEAEKFIESYKYSSYLDYVNKKEVRPEGAILNKIAFPDYFEKMNEFEQYVSDWLAMEGAD